MRRRIFLILAVSAGSVTVSLLFRLWLPLCGVVWLVSLLFFLYRERSRAKERKAEGDYYDVTTYMEQLLCSYKRLGKLRPSLEDCATLFPEHGDMGGTMRKALHMICTGDGVEEEEIAEGALGCIGRRYPSRRLELMHDFLCRAEKMGGDTEASLDILLHDLQMWKKRTALYQKKKQFIRIESGISAVLAGVLCLLSRFLMPDEIGHNLTTSLMYQTATVVFLVMLFITEALILKKLSGNWLDSDSGMAAKERGRGRADKEYKLAGRRQDGMRERMARKICRREVEGELPYWFLSVILYLQQESVFQALGLSLKKLHGFFYEEVKKLRERIYDSPSSLAPYTDFFRTLAMPEVQTGMKLLYAVNANGYRETGKQIRFLVDQNNMLMAHCEEHQFETQLAGMRLLRQIPMALAGIKVVMDMITFLMGTMVHYVTVW